MTIWFPLMRTLLSETGLTGVAQASPPWEAELSRYLSAGDGDRCPLGEECAVVRGRGECSDPRLHGPQAAGRRRAGREKLTYRTFGCASPDGPVRGRIFELVEMLSGKYLAAGGVTGPPVPWRIVEQLGVSPPLEVRFLALKVHHGAVWRLQSAWIVYINSSDPPDSQRFSLFHELFHILAHCGAAPVFRRRGREEGAFNEMLANYFAACTMMPAGWVRERLGEVKSVGAMARLFQVRECNMSRRLKALRLI